ncbi:hypothetical protein [Paraclostridium dentum]|uniref:hypothetical protein n=1 Tax=Paraclostridium dentum TaxID=2662455 RepID=UPI003F311245
MKKREKLERPQEQQNNVEKDKTDMTADPNKGVKTITENETEIEETEERDSRVKHLVKETDNTVNKMSSPPDLPLVYSPLRGKKCHDLRFGGWTQERRQGKG